MEKWPSTDLTQLQGPQISPVFCCDQIQPYQGMFFLLLMGHMQLRDVLIISSVGKAASNDINWRLTVALRLRIWRVLSRQTWWFLVTMQRFHFLNRESVTLSRAIDNLTGNCCSFRRIRLESCR